METLKSLWNKIKNVEVNQFRFRVVFIVSSVLLIVVVVLSVSLVSQPEYHPGLELEDNLITLETEYANLCVSYEGLATDYNNIRDSLVKALTDSETSKQYAVAYQNAYNELLQSFQALSVANQLLEASNKTLTTSSDVSKEFYNQYNDLEARYKEQVLQYRDLVDEINGVSDKKFFVVTDNYTQADIDTFYEGWDVWMEAMIEEEVLR